MAATDNNTQYQANSVITTANSGTVIAATSMVIVPSSGNVGIGTTIPAAGLDANVSVIVRRTLGVGTASTPANTVNALNVYGNIALSNIAASGGGIYYPDGSYQTTAAAYNNSNVANYLSGPVLVGNLYVSNSTASTSNTTGSLITNGGAAIGGNLNINGSIVTTGSSGNITGVNTMFAAKIGVGTTTSVGASNAFTVYGNVSINSLAASGSGIYFPDGTFQTTAFGGAGTGVSSFSAGTTGLTPAVGTGGVVTLAFGTSPTAAGIYSPSANVLSLSTSSVEALRITSTGNVSMTNNLTVTGEVTAYYSDRRLKDNIETITNAINIVNSITGVYYNANDLAVELLHEDRNVRRVGVLAQEIQAVMPEIVRQAPFDIAPDGSSISGENYQTVQYDKLVPLLIQAVKEQQAKIEELEHRITFLELDP